MQSRLQARKKRLFVSHKNAIDYQHCRVHHQSHILDDLSVIPQRLVLPKHVVSTSAISSIKTQPNYVCTKFVSCWCLSVSHNVVWDLRLRWMTSNKWCHGMSHLVQNWLLINSWYFRQQQNIDHFRQWHNGTATLCFLSDSRIIQNVVG